MDDGYVKLWRKIIDSEVFCDPWILKLFLWCVLMANWKDKRGLKRGQFETRKRVAAEFLNVSPSRFWRGIQRLIDLGCITVIADHERTIITVCKYADYNDLPDENEAHADHERTTSGPLADHLPYIEERKKGRKEAVADKKPDPATEPDPLATPRPAELDSPAFSAAWSEWITYRRDRRLSLRPTTLAKQIKFLAAFGEVRAIACIEASIRNGWQGLFEPNERIGRNGAAKSEAQEIAETIANLKAQGYT